MIRRLIGDTAHLQDKRAGSTGPFSLRRSMAQKWLPAARIHDPACPEHKAISRTSAATTTAMIADCRGLCV